MLLIMKTVPPYMKMLQKLTCYRAGSTVKWWRRDLQKQLLLCCLQRRKTFPEVVVAP